MASVSRLAKKIAAPLDQMVSAQLDLKAHVTDLLQQKISKTRIPRPVLYAYHHPLNEREAYERAVRTRNIHKHTTTCFKGRTTEKWCGHSQPQQTVSPTRCVHLDLNRDDEDFVNI